MALTAETSGDLGGGGWGVWGRNKQDLECCSKHHTGHSQIPVAVCSWSIQLQVVGGARRCDISACKKDGFPAFTLNQHILCVYLNC